MAIPIPTRLFHITAIANLAAICKSKALLSKNDGAAAGIAYQNIAHAGAQGARAVRRVPNPPGGVVHDYVPFYFAPRSPMLYAINKGAVDGCEWRQPDIVHFETTIDSVLLDSDSYVFYDLNATLAWSTPYTDLDNLHVVAWELITEAPCLDGFCKYWQNRADSAKYADRMERRQAEFLVKKRVKLRRMTRVGVINAGAQKAVQSIFKKTDVEIPVVVKPEWYF